MRVVADTQRNTLEKVSYHRAWLVPAVLRAIRTRAIVSDLQSRLYARKGCWAKLHDLCDVQADHVWVYSCSNESVEGVDGVRERTKCGP